MYLIPKKRVEVPKKRVEAIKKRVEVPKKRVEACRKGVEVDTERQKTVSIDQLKKSGTKKNRRFYENTTSLRHEKRVSTRFDTPFDTL